MLSPKTSLLRRGMFCFASLLGVVALSTAASVRPCPAATVTQVGSDISNGTVTNTLDRWRTTDYVKPLDADGSAGNYVYGTAGYRLYASAQPTPISLPTFVSSVTPLVNGTQGPISGWGVIDNAALTGIGPVANVDTGMIFNNATGVGDPLKAQPVGTEADFLEITLSANQNFRLGIVTGNIGGAAFNPASLRVRQTVGGSGNSGLMVGDSDFTVANDNKTDYYFFDIVGGALNDKYRVSLVSSAASAPSGTVYLHGVTFDVLAEAVPEPSTFVLAALGLAGMGLVAWRRRK
ncbi:MAG: PEP-CTERM sorting domain-containing protein [Planctomycetes bacterium]|nr:PEP-CTERM sorting domain-containing protein [Planctomycetota bacterium]